jgi:hypothetical protein
MYIIQSDKVGVIYRTPDHREAVDEYLRLRELMPEGDCLYLGPENPAPDPRIENQERIIERLQYHAHQIEDRYKWAAWTAAMLLFILAAAGMAAAMCWPR